MLLLMEDQLDVPPVVAAFAFPGDAADPLVANADGEDRDEVMIPGALVPFSMAKPKLQRYSHAHMQLMQQGRKNSRVLKRNVDLKSKVERDVLF